ncbi:MAG: PspC domain-containing protein [Tomitella sp.]|nr:PspC domain-containing protein [Tomitella sp.]
MADGTLSRVRDGKMLGGVCAGLAQHFGWSTSTVRIVFVVSCLLPGPQVLLYLLLWIVMPLDKR